MKKRNFRSSKLTAFLAAVTALSVLSGCNSAPDSVPEENGTESVSASENMSEAIPDNLEQEEDVSDIFAYKIKDGYVRINRYKGSDPVVVIPDTIEGLPVKTINENAFYDLNITELTLPAGIENVSAKIINHSKELRNIYISEGSENYISVDGVIYTADGKTLAMYPGGRMGEAEIAEGVTRIGDRAFFGCCISEVTLPDTVEEIGISAFERCSELKEIAIPDSVKAIEPYAFCSSGVESVTLNEGVESIGTGAFESTKITEIYLPDSLKEAGSYILGSRMGVKISASEPSEGLKELDRYRKLSYRSETVLNAAIRKAERMAVTEDSHYRHRAYFTDINGDNFPEMLLSVVSDFGNVKENPECLYYYNSEEMEWRRLYSTGDVYFQGYDYSVKCCRDRESSGYIYLGIGSFKEDTYYLDAWIYDENGMHRAGGSGMFYSIGDYWENEGYISCFEGMGKYEIYVQTDKTNIFYPSYSEQTDFMSFAENFIDNERYEFTSEFDFAEIISEIMEQYSDSEEDVIMCGDFACAPGQTGPDFEFTAGFADKEHYDIPSYNAVPNASVITSIGDREYDKYSYSAYLDGDEITSENFEKLSALPCLTSLYLSCDEDNNVIDLAGIDKLSGLRELHISMNTLYEADKRASITNAECLKNMELLWLSVNGNIEDIGFVAECGKVRVLDIGRSVDIDENFYSAVSDMDSPEFILVSDSDNNITQGQNENIRKLRPDIRFCYYK